MARGNYYRETVQFCFGSRSCDEKTKAKVSFRKEMTLKSVQCNKFKSVSNVSRLALKATLTNVLIYLLLCSVGASGQRMEAYCKFSPSHTMCRTAGIGPACGSRVLRRGVDAEDAETIVMVHNIHRARVASGKEARGAPGPQPSAADMLQMEWDEELALVAQRHADQCVFGHDCGDCRRVERFSVGQNLYTESRTNEVEETNWTKAIDAWYEEVNLMPKSSAPSYNFSPATGHYTQVVWGTTNKVGCGYIMYRENSWYKKLYTCNYGPAGNIITLPMYETGPPCSKCPQGTTCSVSYHGLCGASEVSTTSKKDQGSSASAHDSSSRPSLSLSLIFPLVFSLAWVFSH